jgi:hypothetical protein
MLSGPRFRKSGITGNGTRDSETALNAGTKAYVPVKKTCSSLPHIALKYTGQPTIEPSP